MGDAMPGLLDIPTPPGNGLLQRVIFDRIRQQGLLGTEGMARAYGGGGRTMLQQELPLEGGKTISRNVTLRPPEVTYEPRYKWEPSPSGQRHHVYLKSGVRLQVDQLENGYADMMFSQPRGEISSAFRGRAYEPRGDTSTKRGIERFSEVFDAMKDYVAAFRPRGIEFSGATTRHQRIYDRIVPKLAQELGAKRFMAKDGFYRLHLAPDWIKGVDWIE